MILFILTQVTSEARDLAFHARAPNRADLKPRVRVLLGEAFDRLDSGDWRPAFEDACTVLEEECRKYLLRRLKMGGVKYKSGNKIKTPTAVQIKKMTMGALKDTFCKLVSQNQLEANPSNLGINFFLLPAQRRKDLRAGEDRVKFE